MIFRAIKKFGNWGREGGGVCGIELALWDLVGKVYGVPCYQFLGGKYRDRVRLYADTPTPAEPTPEAYAERRGNCAGKTPVRMAIWRACTTRESSWVKTGYTAIQRYQAV